MPRIKIEGGHANIVLAGISIPAYSVEEERKVAYLLHLKISSQRQDKKTAHFILIIHSL